MSDHVLRLGDCLDPVTGLASLPDKSVDHVICDPPYEAEAHTLQRRTLQFFQGPRRAGVEKGATPKEKPVGFDAITEDLRSAVALEIARVARRWSLAFCQAEAVGKWKDALEAGPARHRRAAIWVKPNGQPQLTGDRPGMGYESIVCAHAIGKSRWNGGGKHGVYVFPTDTWMTEVNNGTMRIHPTQKPLDLMLAIISDFTDPGELICDPFAGSGTTGVACKRLGRRFVGWEKDPKFHTAAVKRIEAAREQGDFFRRPPKPKQGKLLP